MTSRLGPAVSGIGWRSDIIVLDGRAPVHAALRQLDAVNAQWAVIVRHGGQYLYAFSVRELRDRLRDVDANAGDGRSLEAALQLHEEHSSTQVPDSSQLAPIDLAWRPNETTPSVFRYVELDAAGRPVAVGGQDVKRLRRVRGWPEMMPPVDRAPPAHAVPPEPAASAAMPEPASAARPASSASAAPLSASPSASPSASRTAPLADIAPTNDEGTAPIRYPSIRSGGALIPGAPITLIVDLLHQVSPTTTGGALAVGELAADWQTMELGVTLVSAGIDFDGGGRGKLTIRRNAKSIAARIRGQVLDTLRPGDKVDVQAQFWHGTRCTGSALRSFVIAQTGIAAAAPRQPATRGVMQADPRAVAPDLTVYITLFDRSAPGRMHWRMVTEAFDGLPPKMDGLIDLGQDARAEAAAMFKQFAKLDRGKHRARIEGFGETLWDRAPPEFREVYWALHDHHQRPLTIQFCSDDPHLPWELMRPFRDGEVHPPLALRHAVARWIGRYQGWMSNRLPSGKLIAMAPKYSSASARLSQAEAAAEGLVTGMGATRLAGTVAALRGLLEQPPQGSIAMLYFSGHGLFDAACAAASAIKLEDGMLAVDEVGRREVQLGERDGTLVFFNACEVGATAGTLGDVGGWASAFVSRRFRAFIAPLWAIDEEDAAQVTQELMTKIVTERQPIGAALRDLRAKHGDTSPTFLSYLLYGDVTASLGATG